MNWFFFLPHHYHQHYLHRQTICRRRQYICLSRQIFFLKKMSSSSFVDMISSKKLHNDDGNYNSNLRNNLWILLILFIHFLFVFLPKDFIFFDHFTWVHLFSLNQLRMTRWFWWSNAKLLQFFLYYNSFASCQCDYFVFIEEIFLFWNLKNFRVSEIFFLSGSHLDANVDPDDFCV